MQPSQDYIGDSGPSNKGTSVVTSQSNQTKPYARVHKSYGEMRVYPNNASIPYIEIEGSGEQQVTFYNALFDLGIGEYDVADIRLGETLITNYDLTDEPVVVHTNTSNDFTLYSKNDIFTDSVNTNLNEDGNSATRTTQINTKETEVILNFPKGLYGLKDNGDRTSNTVRFQLDYKKTTDINFVPVDNEFLKSVTGFDKKQLYQENYNIQIKATDVVLLPDNGYGQRYKNTFEGSSFEVASGKVPDINAICTFNGKKYVVTSKVQNVVTFDKSLSYVYYSDTYTTDSHVVKMSVQEIPISDISITLNFDSSYFISFVVNFEEVSQYDFRVTRVSSTSNGGYENIKDVTWSQMKSISSKNVLTVDTLNKHTFFELRIKATDQLSGSIDDLNCITTSKLKYFARKVNLSGTNQFILPEWTPSGDFEIELKIKPSSEQRSVFLGSFAGADCTGPDYQPNDGNWYFQLAGPSGITFSQSTPITTSNNHNNMTTHLYRQISGVGTWSIDGVQVGTQSVTSQTTIAILFNRIGSNTYTAKGDFEYVKFTDLADSSKDRLYNAVQPDDNWSQYFIEDSVGGQDGTLSGMDNTDGYIEGWSSDTQATSNPAYIFADILCGTANQRRLSYDRIDIASIKKWKDFCDTENTISVNNVFGTYKHDANFVVGDDQSVKALLQSLCSLGRATLHIFSGNYGVLIDEFKDTPVQMFTTRNYKGFTSNRRYQDKIDALKVEFANGGKGYSTDECVVFADNISSLNDDSIVAESKGWGITNFNQAFSYGRYMYAQTIHRQEDVSIEVDIEYLACQRLDLVLLQQDSMKLGGFPARIKAVNGNDVTIDAPNNVTVNTVQLRLDTPDLDGNYVINQTCTIDNTNTILTVEDGSVFTVGNLCVVGEGETTTGKYLVKEIQPNENLGCNLRLIEYSDQVYYADSTAIGDYDTIINNSINDYNTPDSVNLLLNYDPQNFTCNKTNEYYEMIITLNWTLPDTSTDAKYYEIYVSKDNENLIKIDETDKMTYSYLFRSNDVGSTFNFVVIAVSYNNKKRNAFDESPVSLQTNWQPQPYIDVTSFNSNINNEQIELSWLPVNNCGLSKYIIRYSPELNASWSTSYAVVEVPKNQSSITISSRIGTYSIKAYDFLGNQSEKASLAITQIPDLYNYNIVTDVDDTNTGLSGSRDNTVIVNDDIRLGLQSENNYYNDGWYYYSSSVDLTKVYEAKFTSKIQAYGYSDADLMSNWDSLADVNTLSTISIESVLVESYLREVTKTGVVSQWDLVSNVTNVANSGDIEVGEWKRFTSGEFTLQACQFAIRLISNDGKVTPSVYDTTIEVDMPDRIEQAQDLQSLDTITEDVYAPFFKEKPLVQISIDDAQTGDYWKITQDDETGFFITFYDSQDNIVARKFDYLAKGYGYQSTLIV